MLVPTSHDKNRNRSGVNAELKQRQKQTEKRYEDKLKRK